VDFTVVFSLSLRSSLHLPSSSFIIPSFTFTSASPSLADSAWKYEYCMRCLESGNPKGKWFRMFFRADSSTADPSTPPDAVVNAGEFYRGKVLGVSPSDPERPESPWECLKVRWEGGEEERISPWEIEFLPPPPGIFQHPKLLPPQGENKLYSFFLFFLCLLFLSSLFLFVFFVFFVCLCLSSSFCLFHLFATAASSSFVICYLLFFLCLPVFLNSSTLFLILFVCLFVCLIRG
jgi:hypothetical protein